MDRYRSRPLKTALYTSLGLFLLGPWVGAAALTVTLVGGLVFAARRHRVQADEGGLEVGALFGLLPRWVPYASIDRLEIEGQELVARDARGRVVCRHFEVETAKLVEAFTELDAAVTARNAAPTGLERGGRGLAEWLRSIDAQMAHGGSNPYRSEPWSWERVTALFLDATRPADVRAAAAWALLASSDPSHAAIVERALGPRLPPLVLAVCALRSPSDEALRLARARLRFLARPDRGEWKRLRVGPPLRVEPFTRARVADTDVAGGDAPEEPAQGAAAPELAPVPHA